MTDIRDLSGAASEGVQPTWFRICNLKRKALQPYEVERMVILVNCPKCKNRFTSDLKPPKQEKDQAADVNVVCPDCKHEFQFRMSGFPVDE